MYQYMYTVASLDGWLCLLSCSLWREASLCLCSTWCVTSASDRVADIPWTGFLPLLLMKILCQYMYLVKRQILPPRLPAELNSALSSLSLILILTCPWMYFVEMELASRSCLLYAGPFSCALLFVCMLVSRALCLMCSLWSMLCSQWASGGRWRWEWCRVLSAGSRGWSRCRWDGITLDKTLWFCFNSCWACTLRMCRTSGVSQTPGPNVGLQQRNQKLRRVTHLLMYGPVDLAL